MPTEVILPRVDMDMSEGRISRWYVEEGASVTKGQPIFEIETEKAAMEVEAPASGVIRDLSVTLHVPLPVGSVIALIDAEGEGTTDADHRDAAKTPGSGTSPAMSLRQAERAPPPEQAYDEECAADDPGSAQRATPLARRLARETGIDIFSIEGSGPKGRVQGEDVERARLESKAARSMPGRAGAAKASRAPLHFQWLRRGEGPPVILIHGFGADLNAWRLFLASARLGSPVLAIDLPGHGGSAAKCVASFDAMVDEVAATLQAESPVALHLAGHSLGGAVAAALSRREAIKALSLFLVAPAGLGPDINGDFISGFPRARSAAELEPLIAQLVKDPAVLGPSFIKATLRQRKDVDAALEEVGALLFPGGTQSFSIRSIFDHLVVPAKIVVGAQDQIIPSRHARGLPGEVAIHSFPELGHMPHLEAPIVIARLLKELMRSAQ
ncbi:MAG: acetoin dehydrogenase dihydrolipoyllysine-residue acetyltransferase subunit [Hyphomicrobiales bacterium]|nr:acetoin dehydrogenase dihydrolipoyllysine-residue acetyltransferase subunit [Hyphomicrobiales bacterium]